MLRCLFSAALSYLHYSILKEDVIMRLTIAIPQIYLTFRENLNRQYVKLF